jgi:hypothetical protein
MSKPKTLLEPVKNRMPKPLSVNLLIDPEHWRGFVRTAKAPIRAVDGIYISIEPFHLFCYFDETGLFASITATMKPAIKYILALLKGCGGARLGRSLRRSLGLGPGGFLAQFPGLERTGNWIARVPRAKSFRKNQCRLPAPPLAIGTAMTFVSVYPDKRRPKAEPAKVFQKKSC